jgi:beta-lactamase class A
MTRGKAFFALLALGAAPAFAAPVPAGLVIPAAKPVATSVQAALEAQVLTLEKQIHGRIGVAVRLLETGETAEVHAEPYPMASTYKVAVAGAVLTKIDHGGASLDQMIPVTQLDFDRTGEPADHVIHPGVVLSVANLMELMLTQSNNTATDKLFALAGGPAAVTAYLRQIGITGIRVDDNVNDVLNGYYGFPYGTPFGATFEKLYPTPEAQAAAEAKATPNPRWDADVRDTAIPSAMVDLLSKQLASPLLKESSRVFLAGVMERCETGAGRIKGMLPAGTVVAHKTGTIGGTVNDVGMITLPEGRGHLLIAVYTKGSDLPEDKREHAVAEIARTAFDYFTMR